MEGSKSMKIFSKADIDAYLHENSANNVTSSPHTTRGYRGILTKYLEFGAGVIDDDIARSYRDVLTGTYDTIQVKRYLYILSGFFQSLSGAGTDNPFYELSRAYRKDKREVASKKIRRDEKVLSEIDVKKMVNRAEEMCGGTSGVSHYVAYRNYFMVKTLAQFGMRIEGLVGILTGHIDQALHKMTVYASKNKIPYPVPLIDYMDDIRSYLNVRARFMSDCVRGDHVKGNQDPALFLSQYGRQLSVTGARNAVNEISKSVGLYEPNRSTHQLRHYRATRYYRDGMAPQLISAIMGMSEATLRSTYLHLTDQDTVREYEVWAANRTAVSAVVCPRCGYNGDVDEGKHMEREVEAIAPKLKIA